MRFIGDLHIHSHYSRATSREMIPETIHKWAQIKGITVVATGDFTHPGWLRELTEKMEPAGNGLLTLRKEFASDEVPGTCGSETFFLLSAEISSIYKKNGKTRKVHSLLFVPDLQNAAKINLMLSRIGNIHSDGRPILGLDAKELLKIAAEACPDVLFVPAHAWTPHFSVLGAQSGFDSLDECFDELSGNIRAIETGLSSDPAMNWKLSALDNINLISNSDAHSPAKMGREANIFDTDISFTSIRDAITTKRGMAGTIEFFPEEGKYHYDGHRACGLCLSPEETILNNYLCPRCGKKVTVGVLHRVEQLADRTGNPHPEHALPYHSIIPLAEILSEILGVGPGSKAVEREYMKMIGKFGSEFSILLDAQRGDFDQSCHPHLGEAVMRMRAGKIHISPGYDGEYGRIKLFGENERREQSGQDTLF